MSLETISCPKCDHKFPASHAFTSEIERKISEAKKADEQKYSKLQAERDRVAKEKIDQKEKELEQIKLQRASEQKTFDEKNRQIDEMVEDRAKELAIQREKMLRAKVQEEFKLDIEDRETQILEQKTKLDEFRTNLLQLQADKRALEEQNKDRELLNQKKLVESAKELEHSIREKVNEEYSLKESEYKRQINDINNKLTEAQRRAEQKSQQAQGEVLEAELESQLKSAFRDDIIEEVAKGVAGADVHQTIFHTGAERGLIIWETKNAKNWSNDWITKLKDDQRREGADAAILVTQTPPKSGKRISEINGVWVCDLQSATIVGQLLRKTITDVHRERSLAVGKGSEMEHVYDLVTGPAFKQYVETIVETFQSMQDTLNKEQVSTMKNWKVRGEQIKRLTNNTIEMYGSLQAIAGKQLPSVSALELADESVSEEEITL